MKKAILILAASFSLFLFSCQKEITLDIPTNNQGGSGNTSDISGNWKFIHFTANTLAVNETSDGIMTLKTVTTSKYTSENNTGTVVFTNTSMTYTNLGYSVNTIAKGLIYEDGILIDSITMPMQMSLPAMNGQSAFTRVGTDSLSFPAGGGAIGGGQTSGPSGAKLKFEQDKLYLTQRVNEATTSNMQGIIVKESKQAEVVTVFQRL